MRRVFHYIVLCVAIACTDREPVGPAAQSPDARISDAVHGAGNAHFYFLPPLVPAPSFTGSFDASLSPVVEICAFASSECATPLVARFSSTSGPGSETVRLDVTAQQYVVNWHTDQFSLDPATTYRIRTLVAGTELGYADVDVVVSAGQAKNVNTGEFIPLVNGRTLPIKFRVEVGAVHVVTSSGAAVSAANGNVILDLPAGAVTTDLGLTVEPSLPPAGDPRSVPGAFYEFGPDGTAFLKPVQLTIHYDLARMPPGVPEASLRLHKVALGGLVEVPGSSVDPVAHTVSGTIHGFSQYGPGWSGNVGWDSVPAPGGQLRGVWGSSATDVFAVGFAGTILHHDGSTWSRQTSGVTQRLNAVWGTAGNDVYAAGDGVVLRYNGSQWQTMLQTFVPTGQTDPQQAALGDLNRDGRLDVVVLGRVGASGDVAVLLDDGAGRFGPPLHTAIAHARSLVLLDADADGLLDLATCSIAYSGAPQISVALGTGNGSFAPAGDLPLTAGCQAIGSADMNGDLVADLVVGTGGGLSVLLGDGFGGFGQEHSFAVPNNPLALTARDFNGDAAVDIAVTTSSGVSVLLGDGTGDLGPATEYAAGVRPHGNAAGDLNGDGKLDLVVTNFGSTELYPYAGSVSVLTGTGAGSFGPPASFTVGAFPDAVGVADVNGDGRLDVVTGRGWGFSVLLNTGAGFASVASYGAGQQSSGTAVPLAIGDVTGDGLPDIVSPAFSRGVDILPNIGSGRFRSAGEFYGLWGASPTDIYAVGLGETILHFDGITWAPVYESGSTDCSLMGTWGSSGSDVFVVSDCGFVHRFNGSGWTRENVGTDQSLNGVWGSASNDVYAVGATGTVLHYDGAQWSPIALPPPGVLFPQQILLEGVWGSSGVDVFVMGWETLHGSGHIVHYDGIGWSWQYFGYRDPFSATFLHGVWGSSSNDIWAVGTRILHAMR